MKVKFKIKKSGLRLRLSILEQENLSSWDDVSRGLEIKQMSVGKNHTFLFLSDCVFEVNMDRIYLKGIHDLYKKSSTFELTFRSKLPHPRKAMGWALNLTTNAESNTESIFQAYLQTPQAKRCFEQRYNLRLLYLLYNLC